MNQEIREFLARELSKPIPGAVVLDRHHDLRPAAFHDLAKAVFLKMEERKQEGEPVRDNSNNSLKDMINDIAQRELESKSSMSEQQKVSLAIRTLLGELGGLTVTEDDVLFTGDKIVLPAVYEGRVLEASKYLRDYYDAQEKHYSHAKKFNYRPLDGAHAFQSAMLRHFGTAGLGKSTYSFFGENPPQMITVETDYGTSTQVPWGHVEFPPLEATFQLGVTHDRELGELFVLNVEAPKKYRRQIAAFFDLVEEELRDHSIYKGKAVNGADQPRFLDLSGVDPSKVVYTDDVLLQLDVNFWSLLKYTDTMRANGLPLKRSVLVEGTYGTGKTLAGYLTAQHAVANGWTFLLCRPGQDDLFKVLQTARLYAPSVVWFEDIDIMAKGGTSEDISRLLDALDGLQGKGVDVVSGFTTNHVEKIHKGVLRPGRLDAIIHIGELDAAGYRKLVNKLIPEKYVGDIDYEQLVKAFHEYTPAFVNESVTSAMRFVITRTGGELDTINTEDIVNAANAKRRQLELMTAADESVTAPSVDSVLRGVVLNTVAEVIDHTEFNEDNDGERGLLYNEDRDIEN